MEGTWVFVLNSIFLGVGLAMDAFSVSMADGLNEPDMGRRKMLGICGCFAAFQAAMPMLGWYSVRRMLCAFKALIPLIPWACLVILCLIGGSMILEAFHQPEGECQPRKLTGKVLFLQGLATSLDALSVGFAIAEYGFSMAAVSAAIIALVTFPICLVGVLLGRKVGMSLSCRAMLLGGGILIAVGIEIWARGIF